MTNARAGRLEVLVLEELWRLGEATVADVYESLRARRRIAPTTVATILHRMEAKGLVAHRNEERRFVYRPLVERRALRRGMITELVDQLFGGSAAELVSHLVEEGHVDRRQLARLRRLIDTGKSPRRVRRER